MAPAFGYRFGWSAANLLPIRAIQILLAEVMKEG
jgi:hypothetical protein